MAGVARIVIGAVVALLGIPVLFYIPNLFVGILFVVVGIFLILSGVTAHGVARRIAVLQMQSNAVQRSDERAITSPRQPSSSVATNFCPFCGAPAAAGSAFCRSCGKAVPR
jgi:sulfite exporter TauE/SafE